MAEVKEKVSEPEMGLNFEKVWAMFQETRKLIEENAKKSEKEMAESRKEMERVSKETRKEIAGYIKEMKDSAKELDRQMGKIGNRFGDVIEHLVIPDIVNKFNGLGYKFTDSAKERKFEKEDGSPLAQVDIFLENGEYLMAVEVKAKPNEADVDDHIQRLRNIRAIFDKRGEKRKLLGAIAGAVINDNVCKLALNNGLYVLKQSGETMKLLAPQGKPRMWLPAQ